MIDSHYLSPEGRAIVKARADMLRDQLAANRILRASAQSVDIEAISEERREGERRSGEFDRRQGDRRMFATMADKLAAEAHRHDNERKYTGERLTDFGGDL